jgi:hypothetical protein
MQDSEVLPSDDSLSMEGRAQPESGAILGGILTDPWQSSAPVVDEGVEGQAATPATGDSVEPRRRQAPSFARLRHRSVLCLPDPRARAVPSRVESKGAQHGSSQTFFPDQ